MILFRIVSILYKYCIDIVSIHIARPWRGGKTSYTFWTFLTIFSRGNATLHLAVSVGKTVRPSEIFLKLQAIYALLLLPNRPRLYCRVSGLVSHAPMFLLFCWSFTEARDCCPFGLVYFPKVIPIYFHYCFSRYLSVIRWVLSSIDWSVHRSLLNIFESLAKFALLPLPNHPRDCLAVLPALFLVNICFCLKKKKTSANLAKSGK